MRIERHPSRLSFRSKRRRRSGCLSWAVLVGLIVGVITVSWNWFSQRLHVAAPGQDAEIDLRPAQAAFDRGDLDGAIDLAQQVLTAQPDHAAALTLLTRALIYRSYSDYNRAFDRESALQVTSSTFNVAPRDLDVLAAHALALQANDQPARAAEIAQRILDAQPDHVLARVALALAYSGVGSHDVALRESLRAAQADSSDVDAQRTLALSYGGVGDFDNAIVAVERAIALNGRLPLLYFERASYARQLGDADGATVAYFQILTHDPDNAKARLRLCELSSLLRERESAVEYCQQVTTIAPMWADGWYQLGREYFLQGDFKQAQDNLHRCSSLQVMQAVPAEERRFECWYLQGQAAELLGDCVALLETYNEYRVMAADAGLRQTWLYPPEGPPACADT
jgi:tetratricopeptide (TPR) repeat protein